MRSRLLWDIGQITGERYLDVPDLKAKHPEFVAAFPRLGTIASLQALLEHLESGEPLPAPASRQQTGRPRKATLNPEEMFVLQEQGKTLREIGAIAGVSAEAVRLAIAPLKSKQKPPC